MNQDEICAKSVIILAGGRVHREPITDALAEVVGAKAAGLATLPTKWIPPFFVVPASENPSASAIEAAAAAAGIAANAQVYVRSSGTKEGMSQRGLLESVATELPIAHEAIVDLRKRLGERSVDQDVHFIVQQRVSNQAKGHLSNERHISRVARDWVAEIEASPLLGGETAPVAIRRWRDASTSTEPLGCGLRELIPRTLRAPAAWLGTSRAHLEWVWDGSAVWIVQRDLESNVAGENPHRLVVQSAAGSVEPERGVLKSFDRADKDAFEEYPKLGNAHLYQRLGYEMPPFYILNNAATLSAIQSAEVPAAVSGDLEVLCQAPFVLRTDGRNLRDDQKHMLPRSDELRDEAGAVEWLRERFSKAIQGLDVQQSGIALIGHHFMPAAASAWCLAFPDRRRVRVEALWGIPEGLYYFPHDVFDIDTGDLVPSKMKVSDARIVGRRIRHKGKFIAPDSAGNWNIHSTANGPDWASCVKRDEWLQEIAVTSRRIAESTQEPTVVMWFIDIPSTRSRHPIVPWYHTEWTQSQSDVARATPAKAARAPVRVIRTANDLEELLADTQVGASVGVVAIDPIESEIVRNHNFIERLAKDAKQRNYIVELRGGILSHAFYALSREGCAVRCVDLFEPDEETIEYNKIVRDKIPDAIASRGEDVTVVEVRGEALIAGLKHKLVEEALEVDGAMNVDAIAEELADVIEVVDAIAAALGLERTEVTTKQKAKRTKRGGFSDGLMLVSTRLPSVSGELHKLAELPRRIIHETRDLPSLEFSVNLDTRTEEGGNVERQITLSLPLLAETFNSGRHSVVLNTTSGDEHRMQFEAITSRVGSELRVRFRLTNAPVQLELF